MLNSVQHLTSLGTYETLNQPMKQVQGMVQGDRYRLFKRSSILNFAICILQFSIFNVQLTEGN